MGLLVLSACVGEPGPELVVALWCDLEVDRLSCEGEMRGGARGADDGCCDLGVVGQPGQRESAAARSVLVAGFVAKTAGRRG